MFNIKQFVVILMITLGISASSHGAAAQSCGIAPNSFIQFTMGGWNSGETTIESYKLTAKGILHRARWSDFGQIIGISKPYQLDDTAFKQTVNLLRGTRSKNHEEDGDLGQITSWFNASLYQDSKTVHYVERPYITSQISELVQSWEQEVPLLAPSKGIYVWTNPTVHKSSIEDLSLTEGCATGVAQAIDKAMKTGEIVVFLPNGSAPFLTGSNQYRHTFGAYTPTATINFGVVRAE